MEQPMVTGGAPLLSVVITAHQRVERLPGLLDRLLDDPATGEVVVVADGCSDGTDNYLLHRAAREPRLRPLLQHPNSGQPRARAAGVALARHDYVLSIDDDVLPWPGLVSGHARWHADPRRRHVVLGYMPTALPARRRQGQFATYDYARKYESHVRLWRADPEAIWTHFWAGNFSFARADFRAAVEGYDFPLRYHEDAELGLRLRARGAVPAFDERLRGDHQHQRPWAVSLSEARSSAVGKHQLQQRWPQDRHFDLERLRADSSRPVRLALRVTQNPAFLLCSLALLRWLSRVGGAVRRWEFEERAAHLAEFLVMFDSIRSWSRPADRPGGSACGG